MVSNWYFTAWFIQHFLVGARIVVCEWKSILWPYRVMRVLCFHCHPLTDCNSFKGTDPDPGSGILLTLDPGWKNSDPGSSINIPHPQHSLVLCMNWWIDRYGTVPGLIYRVLILTCYLATGTTYWYGTYKYPYREPWWFTAVLSNYGWTMYNLPVP